MHIQKKKVIDLSTQTARFCNARRSIEKCERNIMQCRSPSKRQQNNNGYAVVCKKTSEDGSVSKTETGIYG